MLFVERCVTSFVVTLPALTLLYISGNTMDEFNWNQQATDTDHECLQHIPAGPS